MKKATLWLLALTLLLVGCRSSGSGDTTAPSVPETRESVHFAMYQDLGWVELGEDDTAMFFRAIPSTVPEEDLQRWGLEAGPAIWYDIRRCSGKFTREGDTYTLTVEAGYRSFALEYSDVPALVQALTREYQDWANFEEMFRGEYVQLDDQPIQKVVFRMAEGRVDHLEVYAYDTLMETCEFYENGNTKTYSRLADAEPYPYVVEYSEDGILKAITAYDGEQMAEYREYDVYGHEVLKIQYLTGQEYERSETQYEYYADGTIKSCIQYDTFDNMAFQKETALVYEAYYYPDGQLCRIVRYFRKGNVEECWEYDEHGMLTLLATYGADGAVSVYERYENRYSEEGVLLERKQYTDQNVLYTHEEYYENGNIRICRIYYASGQLWYYTEYDQTGETVLHIIYNEDGTEYQQQEDFS